MMFLRRPEALPTGSQALRPRPPAQRHWQGWRRAALALGTLSVAAMATLLPMRLMAAEPTRILVPPFDAPRDGRPGYFFEVLDLALKKTQARYGPYEVRVLNETISLERAISELRKGQLIDLVFTPPNPGLTDGLRPIPVSLLKELNNYRVLLIRRGEQARFDKINTLEDLKAMTAGLGLQWVDTKILRHNGFRVEGSVLHEKLFGMLAAKRFDFFPRGIYEVRSDFERYQELGLAIEQGLFLYYEAPFYFFVHPDNTSLATRLEAGLRMAIADGSFDRLLMSYPEFKAASELQRMAARRLLRLGPLPAGCGSAQPAARRCADERRPADR